MIALAESGKINIERSPYIGLLSKIVEKCPVSTVVAGGMGVAGVLNKQIRFAHDLDLIIDHSDGEEMSKFLKTIGYSRIDRQQEEKLLKGGGMVFSNEEELRIDVVSGVFSDEGLQLNFAEGGLFIPRMGLDNHVALDGVSFNTFSPEVFYFLKNRATRRWPWQSISPLNRSQDTADYRELRKIVDQNRANELLEAGFSYKGRHPGITQLKQLIFRFMSGLGG